MKVLLLTESFPPHAGGVGHYVNALAEHLVSRKIDVVVATSSVQQREERPCKVITGKGRTVQSRLKDAYRHAFREQPDIVHAQHLWSTIVARQGPLPFVVTLHDYWPAAFDGTLFDSKTHTNVSHQTLRYLLHNLRDYGVLRIFAVPYAQYRTWKGRKALANAGGYLFNSKYVRDAFPTLRPSAVIYNLFDFPPFKPHAFENPTVVYVGKLEKAKGAHLLPSAMQGVDADLVYIGEGSQQAQLEKRGAICWGYVNNTKALSAMAGADVVVVPSLWNEPLGRTAAEACAVGANVLVTSRGALPEIVQHEKTGLVVEPTVVSLREGILQILSASYGPAAKKRFQKLFDTDRLVENHIKMYEEVL